MVETERAYLAAILDGEGYVGIVKQKGSYFSVQIQVSNTNKRLLNYVRELCGVGNIYSKKSYNKKGKPSWVWQVWSNEAVNILKQTCPYTIAKFKQTIACIHLANIKQPGVGRRGRNNVRQQEKLYLFVRKLNKKGN